MRAWFDGLAPRERRVVLAGAALLVGLLMWALVWAPFRDQYLALEGAVAGKQELAAWMIRTAAQIQALEGDRAPPPPGDGNRSLLATVDQTSRQAGLGPHIKRIEPDGQGAVRLWLEEAPFDPMVGWLVALAEGHGIHARQAGVDGRDTAGRVNARLTLERDATPANDGSPTP
ncbi:MAG: type II secretion system protein M [Gammaproteobacteria bacterium]|nr:type II secretion system protein M [Gammaproteobacteria bacterium]